LNGAAYFDFLQNVLNDPVNTRTIEELTARVMQTAENPEMLVRTQHRLLWSEGHKPA
jgi:hypothetical protein